MNALVTSEGQSNPAHGGIYVDGAVSPTVIRNCWIDTPGYDAIVLNGAKYARVLNNRMTYGSAGGANRAVRLIGAWGCIVENNVAANGNQNDPAIRLESGSKYNRIWHNDYLSEAGTFALPIEEDVRGRNEVDRLVRTFGSQPTTGTWLVGDMVYNSAPVAGTVGWIRTSTGWKAFG